MVNKYLKYGFFVGLFTIGIRLSIITVTEEIKEMAYWFGYSIITLSVIVHASKYIKWLPKFSPNTVYFITGFALSSSIVSFFLYGVDFF